MKITTEVIQPEYQLENKQKIMNRVLGTFEIKNLTFVLSVSQEERKKNVWLEKY